MLAPGGLRTALRPPEPRRARETRVGLVWGPRGRWALPLRRRRFKQCPHCPDMGVGYEIDSEIGRFRKSIQEKQEGRIQCH